MKLLFILLFYLSDPFKTGKVNEIKETASLHFKQEKWQKAITQYTILVDSLDIREPALRLNLAHCYFQLKDSINAMKQYSRLSAEDNLEIRSIANNQMGVLTNEKKEYKKALSFFKNALRANPNYTDARYNYELTKRLADFQEQMENPSEEPSEFAKQLKEFATNLAKQGKYGQAFQAMQSGMMKDKTVSHYQAFIQKLQKVSEVYAGE